MIFTFAGTIAHFINDDWELIERLIDFHQLSDKEHAGEAAARAFVASARKRGGLKQIRLTLDLLSKNNIAFTS